MKTLLIFLMLAAFTPFLQNEHTLDALVFDFSSPQKSTLPADGWMKVNFSVVHYRESTMSLQFKAVCVESGEALPFYPPTERLTLPPGAEQPITLFLNKQCAKLENLPPGQYSRTIRFQFVDVLQQDTLSFDQPYVIALQNEE